METDGSGETKQTLLLLPFPLPLLFLVRLLRRFLVGEKKGKGINRAKRISTPLPRPSAISRLRIQAIPISDKRIIRKSEKLSTLRRSYHLRLRRRRKGNAVDLSLPFSLSSSLPVGDVSQTGKLDSDDRSPFPYGSRSGRKGGWRKVVAAKLIFERGATLRCVRE